jgi:hypothetical protein
MPSDTEVERSAEERVALSAERAKERTAKRLFKKDQPELFVAMRSFAEALLEFQP